MRNSAHLHLIDNITVKYCLTNFFLQKNQFFSKKMRFFLFSPRNSLSKDHSGELVQYTCLPSTQTLQTSNSSSSTAKSAQ